MRSALTHPASKLFKTNLSLDAFVCILYAKLYTLVHYVNHIVVSRTCLWV